MSVANDDLALGANSRDSIDGLHNGGMLGLSRITQFLAEISLANQDNADPGNVPQYVGEIVDPHRVLDLQDRQDISTRRKRPDVGTLVILLLRNAPVSCGDHVIKFLCCADVWPDHAVASHILNLFG